MNSQRNWFWLLCAAFLVLRIALLLFSSDLYFLPDERFMGTIAKSAIDGLVAPLADYQYHPHEGGTLLFGLSAAPFFALFGDSYFSLKLTALAWAFAAFLLWTAYARRCAGDTAAVATAFLLCFAPPGLVRLGLWAVGTQPQCPLLDIAVLTAFGILIRSPSSAAPGVSGRTVAAAILFGFACGFAIYFSFLSAVAVAACLLCWPADRGRSLTPLTGAIFCAGLAAGAAPILLHTLHTGSSVLTLLRAPGGGLFPRWSVAASAGTFLRMLLLDKEWMNGRMPAAFAQGFQLVYASGIAAGVAWLFLSNRKAFLRLGRGLRGARGGDDGPPSPLVPVLFYLALYPIFFACAHLDRRVLFEGRMMPAYRFFALYCPFLIFSLALAVARLWDSGGQSGRDAARSAGMLAAFFCLVPLAFEMRAGQPGLGTRTPGYSYFALGWNFAQKEGYWNVPDRGLLAADRLPASDRDEYLRGFTEVRWWGAMEEMGGGAPAAEALHGVESTAKRAQPRFIPLFYVSLGRVFAMQYLFEERRGVGWCLTLAAKTDPRYFGEIMRGIGQTVGSRDVWVREVPAIAARIPAAHAAEFRRGLAEGRGLRYYHSVYEH